MATTALPLPYAAPGSLSRSLRLYLREIRFELVRSLRNRAFTLSVLGFPMLFYVLFGVVNKGNTMEGGANVAKYLLSSYEAFGIVGAALFGIGVGLALERTSGWLELKRASPMPPFAYLVARCVMAIVFSTVIVSLLCVVGIAFAGVHLTLPEYARMIATAVFGSIPFAGLGLLLATLLPANAAPGIANMIYLPMSYCSGLWVPFRYLPHWVQHLAPWLPTYHLAQLMLHTIGYAQPGDSAAQHVFALLGFTLLFLSVAALWFKRTDADA